MSAAIFLLLIHIAVCIILYLFLRIGLLKSSRMVMAIAWFVPVWGPLCILPLELRTRGDTSVSEEIGLEKLKINDEIYRSILKEEGIQEDQIVPLEEALVLNDTGTRRELMMEIMYGDTQMYVRQLQEARMNDDTEVVHYAVTALVELQKEYDLMFQKMDRRIADAPDDDELLDQYLKLMEQYIGTGLLEGNTRTVQMKNYSGLLAKKIRSGKAELPWYLKKIDIDLKLGEYESAYTVIKEVLDQWPRTEAGYLYSIQYFSCVRNRQGIDHVLSLIRRRKIFLSSEGRKTVEFWKKEEK